MLPGPVTTLSVITGVGCCLAQEGSFAMSIARILGGVPVKVTVPLMVPGTFAGAIGVPMVDAATSTRPSEGRCLVGIDRPFLEVGVARNYCSP